MYQIRNSSGVEGLVEIWSWKLDFVYIKDAVAEIRSLLGVHACDTVVNMSLDPKADQQISVVIEGAAAQVTKNFYFANDMAEGFGIDKSKIPDFDGDAVVEKIVEGPPGFQGLWNVCLVIMAFAPGKYGLKKSATLAVKQTSIADYPSRKEVQMNHNNVS